MKAFEIEINGRKLDYRVGQELDLSSVQRFLKSKYRVLDLRQAGRHVLGEVEKDGKELFLKLATSEGISHLTKAEYEWNEQFNRENPRQSSNYWVPLNFDSGTYKDNLYYLVTDKFEGSLLAERPERSSPASLIELLPAIVEFSELIQSLNINIPGREANPQEFFRAKALAWYLAIPEDVRKDHGVDSLLTIVEDSYQKLNRKTRHGNFTPWHLFSLEGNKLGLIDGEHAMGNGVEYYDMAYLVQRVFCVLENPELAQRIVGLLIDRNYSTQKLKTVLAARGIGGFLDESLKKEPEYTLNDSYKDFVLLI